MAITNTGIVHFVGAGPGAEDLITVRGRDLLERADVVIYAGSLVNPALLKYTRTADIHNSATMTLEEVIDVCKRAAAEGKEIVRLCTGDQSVYGAIKEQMEELDKLGIPYDSCPGVSACFGAAASLNLEYTLPGISQTLILTRMSGKTAVPDKESIKSLSAHRATMAIYLSSSMIGDLVSELIAGGYAPNTPAAIVYKATWPEEKSYLCSLSTLEETAEKNGIKKTAIILVGDVISPELIERSRLYDPGFSTEYRKSSI